MKKISIIIAAILLAMGICTVTYAETDVYHVQDPQDPGEYALDPGTLAKERQEMWEQYRQSALESEMLQEETQNCEMTFGEATMRYFVTVIGESRKMDTLFTLRCMVAAAEIRRTSMTGNGRK